MIKHILQLLCWLSYRNCSDTGCIELWPRTIESRVELQTGC